MGRTLRLKLLDKKKSYFMLWQENDLDGLPEDPSVSSITIRLPFTFCSFKDVSTSSRTDYKQKRKKTVIKTSPWGPEPTVNKIETTIGKVRPLNINRQTWDFEFFLNFSWLNSIMSNWLFHCTGYKYFYKLSLVFFIRHKQICSTFIRCTVNLANKLL